MAASNKTYEHAAAAIYKRRTITVFIHPVGSTRYNNLSATTCGGNRANSCGVLRLLLNNDYHYVTLECEHVR